MNKTKTGNCVTPWGLSHSVNYVGDHGIKWVSTSSHGGVFIPKNLNKMIPPRFRSASGWYEEDCQWSIPYSLLPVFFERQEVENAREVLKHWYPHVEARITGKVPHDSLMALSIIHKFNNRRKYLSLAAWGSWHKDVPQGMVGVFAGKGGRERNGNYPPDTSYFLVPETEYDARNGAQSFVIDEARHKRIEPIR